MGRCGDLFIILPPKTSLMGTFPCLVNLPPTNLECSAFFFGFLLSVCGNQFQISPENLLRLPTSSGTLIRRRDSRAFTLHMCTKKRSYEHEGRWLPSANHKGRSCRNWIVDWIPGLYNIPNYEI